MRKNALWNAYGLNSQASFSTKSEKLGDYRKKNTRPFVNVNKKLLSRKHVCVHIRQTEHENNGVLL